MTIEHQIIFLVGWVFGAALGIFLGYMFVNNEWGDFWDWTLRR